MVLMLKLMCLIILIGGLLYYIFPLCIVSGNSMYPNLKEGDILIATRLFNLKKGSVYIYSREQSPKRYIIKRLDEVLQEKYCYFLGDNPEESYDSRDYGYIKAERIIAKKLAVIKRNKNGGK